MRYVLIALAIAMVFLAARSIERTGYGPTETATEQSQTSADPRCEGLQEDELAPTTPTQGKAACCAPSLKVLPVTATARAR